MAIQAESLRLKNWVLVDGKPVQVTAISETHIEGVRGAGLFGFMDLGAIPLDVDILEKCGFVSLPYFTVMGVMTRDIGRRRMLSIGNIGTPNEMLFIKEVDGKVVSDVVCLWNFDYDGRLYLHQLQNIVSSLTGEQLIVNI